MNSFDLKAFSTALLLLSPSILGCGDSSDGPRTVNASGVLTLDGSPVVEAQIVLVDTQGVPAYATSDKNGKFSFMVSDTKKGAVPGTYPAIITKTKMENVGDGMVKMEQGLPVQYSDPAKSGISITVPESGTSSLKVELVSASKKK